jgi:Response regulator containing a CheY-like receiver domain and an HD-GYP domain
VPNFPKKAWFYIVGIIVLGAGLAAWQLWGLELSRNWLLSWAILVILALLCQLYEIQLIPGHATSAAIGVGVGAVLIGGAKLGISVVLVSTLMAELYLRRAFWRKDPLRYIAIVEFNVSQLLISVAISGFVLQGLGGKPPPYETIVDFLRAGLVFGVFITSNAAIVSCVVHFSRGVNYWTHLKEILQARYVQILSLGILAILIALIYALSPWYMILMLSPLFIVQISLREHMKLQRQAHLAFEKIAKIVSSRDPYTGIHSEEVAELAVKLAKVLNLPEKEIARIDTAARVHDLGKIAVPDAILLKPGPLTEEEWKVMKQHPVVSAEILSGLEIYKDCVDIIRHEHEHWDGSGYPDGLKGEEIPLGSRIIAVADVWHALISDRPYRKAYTKEEARKIMKEMAGKVLDPKLVEIFLQILE